MLTCLCDAFYGDVGISTVRVLEHLGCEVVFPPDQTCCGQPPYNAGNWDEARKIVQHCTSVFSSSGLPVVTPSTSCAAMVREGYGPLGEVGFEIYELGEFIVKKLGLRSIEGASGHLSVRRVAFHRACHGRGLHLTDEHERLLASIPGLELLPIAMGEQCCGFGGAFSIDHPTVSAGIGDEKLRNIIALNCDILVSSDMGCLMHLKGLAAREKLSLPMLHFSQLLAACLPQAAPV